ncbi:MAG: GDSL-type esterase/lipase family protein [Proteobacteria bacterium]|nr:GDSL-type esterase/lipase family protein [Pseudomonadota bacterium]
MIATSTTSVSTPARADRKQPTPPVPAKLEDACVDAGCKQHALDAWRAALAQTQARTAPHPLRISYFGDSLTADDHITDALRKKLQAQLGDGGAGFVWAVPPHPFCQHAAIARAYTGEWLVHGVSTAVPGDRLLGLGGSAEVTDGVVRLTPTGALDSVDLHYLAQPHGGSIEVLADRTSVATIATAGERKKAGFARLDVPSGTKRVELRIAGRVRLFGATLEAKTGAVVDNLGIVNATAKAFAHHNMDEHWKNQLVHRASDLVVVMLGTNEAEWLHKGPSIDEHERVFDELLTTVRAANPTGSCVVVSPLDQLDWRTETMPPRESVPAMVEAQRRAAGRHGCAFWDVYTWMGGKGASRGWYTRGLVVKDFQHPTTAGSELIAAALFAALVP